MKTNIKYSLILIVFVSLFINAQVNSNNNQERSNSRKEKLYLNINKDNFAIGESINISLYILNAITNVPSTVSKIAYVELIDAKNKSIKKIELSLNNSLGTTKLLIPNNIQSGSYKVIAYTNLMQRFNEFSKKDITINQEESSVSSFPKEAIHLHANKDIFTTGEIMKLSLFALNKDMNTPSGISKVAYIELINAEKKSVKKLKVRLKNSLGKVNLFIPNTLSSGSYKVIAYTKWMLNFNSFFEKDVMIYNPFKNDFNGSKISDIMVSDSSTTTLSDSKKATRSLVSLSLNDMITEQGNYSLNVSQRTPFVTTKKSSKNNNTNKPDITYLPEIRGEVIKGKLISETNTDDFSKMKISFSTIGKDGFSLVTNAHKNGDFLFIIDKEFSNDKAYIQVLNNTLPITVKIDSNFTPDLSNLTFQDFIINKEIANYIKENAVYTQIENAYSAVKKAKTTENYSNIKFNNLFKSFKLDDYTRFDSMKETFKEIIIGAWIEETKSETIFKVEKTKNATSAFSKALVMVDGFLVDNHKELLDFKTNTINTITLYEGHYKLNGAMFNGIIIIETFENNYIPKNESLIAHKFPANQVHKVQYLSDYSDNSNDRIPDFNTNLFFENNLHGNEKINFYTSDITGDFDVEIQGFTKKGKPVLIKRTFTVK